MKTDLFQSCGHCWVFQMCWHIECSTFTHHLLGFEIAQMEFHSTSFVHIVMLPKAHLTSHSKMSSSRWVITPLWLSGSWRSFLYSYSVYSCHLFLMSSASVRSITFLSFMESIFAWNVPLVSLIRLKRSLVCHSVVFLYFFALIAEEGFLISSCYSLELCIQRVSFPFLLCFSLLFFSQLFVRPPQTSILLFCISLSWGWSWFLSSVQCHEPPSIVHQALCLSDLVP